MVDDDAYVAGVVLLLVGAAVGAGVATYSDDGPSTDVEPATGTDPIESGTLELPGTDEASVEPFGSEAAFVSYVQRGRTLADGGAWRGGGPAVVREPRPDVVTATPGPVETRAESARADASGGDAGGAGSASAPDRISGTNVQIQGIDEPDVLKTGGSHVYYATGTTDPRRPRRAAGEDRTHVISAATPADPRTVADVDASGQLLLADDRLVVFEDDALVGYDVTDPERPEQAWEHDLDDDVVTARLADGTVYLVTRSAVPVDDPCPIEPVGGAASIRCSDVYHPREQVSVDATYSALALDPATGAVADATSFVGTSENTAVYVSAESLYVTYTRHATRGQLRIDYLLSEQDDRLPDWVQRRLVEIRGYNISDRSTRQETDRVLDRWYRTLDERRQRTVRSEIRNDYRSYLAAHQRNLTRTGIVRVGIDERSLAVETVGTVPGEPLNQFSLDEHEGSLRITTTIPGAGSAQSANDLYTLDAESLTRQGAVTDMGINERVYAVRYVDDTAYVVTFRRIDPFHVVDLSDPTAPELAGELKLPGFSSYLHPIDDDHVLGIGEEDGRVKAVLFDVSDPGEPTVADDFVFESRWSAIAESHHAFLLDRKHGVAFVPTGAGGQVLDYTDGDLSLQASIGTDGPARRAMYVDDYMYVFGTDELAVVDERTWNRTTTVALD